MIFVETLLTIHLHHGVDLGKAGPQLEMWNSWDERKARVEDKKEPDAGSTLKIRQIDAIGLSRGEVGKSLEINI